MKPRISLFAEQEREGKGAKLGDPLVGLAPTQRNKCKEAETVKQGAMPLDWKPHKRAQKDVDAK